MKQRKKTIYVLVHCPTEGRDLHQEWDVIQWKEHPALAPHSGGKRKVSTASGDVELRVPPLVEHNYKVLGWASQRIEQLHPYPEMLALEKLSHEALIKEVLHLSLEYVALAEDGRGHNARSHFIARQLREIQQHTNQSLSSETN
ncbi:MAG: hypothetical protein AAFR67_06650 [Chloroflexota bacterium]